MKKATQSVQKFENLRNVYLPLSSVLYVIKIECSVKCLTYIMNSPYS